LLSRAMAKKNRHRSKKAPIATGEDNDSVGKMEVREDLVNLSDAELYEKVKQAEIQFQNLTTIINERQALIQYLEERIELLEIIADQDEHDVIDNTISNEELKKRIEEYSSKLAKSKEESIQQRLLESDQKERIELEKRVIKLTNQLKEERRASEDMKRDVEEERIRNQERIEANTAILRKLKMQTDEDEVANTGCDKKGEESFDKKKKGKEMKN
ncbi:hypothetical protein PMAYCL1PPCAC_26460, partial [Pristionchus mayeri]